MGINQISFDGQVPISPRLDVSQSNSGQQYIVTFRGPQPIVLQPGQGFIIPSGQWKIVAGRYTDLQWYDQIALRWRNYPTQPGQSTTVSSDGQNFRLANTTGTPIGAVISNVGNGNATNGYNTVTVTVSAGNSTWGTLVGGSLNTTVTVTSNGNYALVPFLIWQPAANQTIPFIPPEFCCNIASNSINTVTVNYPGAGLTAAGSLTVVQAPGDTNPGGAVLTMNATLTNSGNLTAIWPLTQGTEVTSLPTLTFNVGGTMCANVLMDWTVTGFSVSSSGFNYGATKPVTIMTGNGIHGHTQATSLTGTSYAAKLAMPRMAQISALTEANSNVSNGNITLIDQGKNFQAIPYLVVTPQNANGSGPNGNNPAVLTALVGGITDTTYLQVA